MTFDPEHLADVRREYAPPDHYVFQLAPPAFDTQARDFMEEMGWPVVNEDSFWEVYSELLGYFIALEDEPLQVMVSLRMEDVPPKGLSPDDEEYIEVDPRFSKSRVENLGAIGSVIGADGVAGDDATLSTHRGSSERSTNTESDTEAAVDRFPAVFSSSDDDSAVDFTDSDVE